MSEWPPHVTLADVFAIDRRNTDIDLKLTSMIQNYRLISITTAKDAKLGDTEVVLIKENAELNELHTKIVDILEANGAVFNTPAFTRSGFLPHCTVQKSGRVQINEKYGIKQVALVDMFPNGDWQQRKVLGVFDLAS